ncbi:MAG TPA: hypothetical protein VH639_01960 [Bryobacteraceae bacterium]|jgi:hypothetical protein
MLIHAKVVCITAVLLTYGAFSMKSAGASDPGGAQGHSSGLRAKITLPDGTVRMATLEGLGCTSSICSRVAIKGNVNGDSPARFWLDGIAAIKEIANDRALLVMKNGAEHRIALIKDFRVLYLESGRATKLDLTGIKSLEFVSSTN